MAMSPNELRALLATMDAVLDLGKIVKIQGNQEQVNRLMESFEHLKEMRKLAKGPGLSRTNKE